jgi:hypothetical protein
VCMYVCVCGCLCLSLFLSLSLFHTPGSTPPGAGLTRKNTPESLSPVGNSKDRGAVSVFFISQLLSFRQ